MIWVAYNIHLNGYYTSSNRVPRVVYFFFFNKTPCHFKPIHSKWKGESTTYFATSYAFPKKQYNLAYRVQEKALHIINRFYSKGLKSYDEDRCHT